MTRDGTGIGYRGDRSHAQFIPPSSGNDGGWRTAIRQTRDPSHAKHAL